MKTFIGCVERYDDLVVGEFELRLFKVSSLSSVCLQILLSEYDKSDEEDWEFYEAMCKKNPISVLSDRNGAGRDYWIISELAGGKLVPVF